MTYTMPEPRIGENWTSDYRPLKEIAADIRADIKKAKKYGHLPADLKVSVRTHMGSTAGAIDVTLSGWDADRVWEMQDDPMWGRGYGLTAEAHAAEKRVEAIRESYNRDASDSMVDYFEVTYYGSTNWDWKIRP